MKILMKSILFFLVLGASFSVQAARPIQQGQWGFALHGGVAPHFFTRKAGFTSILNGFDANGVASGDITIKQRHFGSHFAIPVMGRAEITYAVMDDLEASIDVDFGFAQGQTIKIFRKNFPSDAKHVVDIRMKNDSLHEVGFHLGLRHYTDLGTNLSPFLGCKFGGRYHNNVNIYHLFDKHKMNRVRFLRGGVAFSAGAELGVNYKLSESFSLVLKGEILGITSYREPSWMSDVTKNGIRSRVYSSNHNRKTYAQNSSQVQSIQKLTTLMPFRAAISLPVTFGLKLHF